MIKFRQWHNNKMVYFEIDNNKLLNVNAIKAKPTMLYSYNQDKHDKDIYHEDIVKFTYIPLFGDSLDVYGIVEINDRSGEWMIDFVNHGQSLYLNKLMDFEGGDIGEIEVIGNIYENPEMFDLEEMELLIGDK